MQCLSHFRSVDVSSLHSNTASSRMARALKTVMMLLLSLMGEGADFGRESKLSEPERTVLRARWNCEELVARTGLKSRLHR